MKGVMNKSGWKEIKTRFYAATGFMHEREQFGNKYRQLKGLWQFIQQLRTDSGLGRRPDGSVLATEAWWKSNTMVRLVCNIFIQVSWPPCMHTTDLTL